MNFKFLIIIISFLAFLQFQSFSQCTPDSFIQPGIYPDTLTNLDSAIVGIAYEDVMTAIIPKDTFVFGKHIPVDSIGIITFSGLPYGFSIEANTSSGYWHGGASGCVRISGMPYDTQIGIYPLHIVVRAFVGGLVSDYEVPGYKLIIDYTVSVQKLIEHNNAIRVYLTTDNQSIKVLFNTKIQGNAKICIYNSSGKVIFCETTDALAGMNNIQIPAGNLGTGVYILSIVTSQKNYFAKFIKLN